MIDGVRITPLRQIVDDRGKVMHMLRSDSEIFEQFGEIYFSCVNPGWVKAWVRRQVMTLNYAVPHGEIRLVLYDDRPGSPSAGQTSEVVMGPDNYCLASVPPMIWSGFLGLGAETSIVANCATILHDPDEFDRVDPQQNDIPYAWPKNQY
jgi:dTDP-4-dehydrorhamnose 3,5-epimerase